MGSVTAAEDSVPAFVFQYGHAGGTDVRAARPQEPHARLGHTASREERASRSLGPVPSCAAAAGRVLRPMFRREAQTDCIRRCPVASQRGPGFYRIILHPRKCASYACTDSRHTGSKGVKTQESLRVSGRSRPRGSSQCNGVWSSTHSSTARSIRDNARWGVGPYSS